jgi:hypothetical protein
MLEDVAFAPVTDPGCHSVRPVHKVVRTPARGGTGRGCESRLWRGSTTRGSDGCTSHVSGDGGATDGLASPRIMCVRRGGSAMLKASSICANRLGRFVPFVWFLPMALTK